ncbi:MAG: aromatic amino acid transport family protein [Rhabdochlamydiaceae bacterium]|nr:aromatic amino acid transport family protein [Candidatus Amphrikana amoebophyrae]
MNSTKTYPLAIRSQWFRVGASVLMIVGTSVGAGMLGIPLVTGESGFYPACLITIAVAIFMMISGLLFLEACLWMPRGSNILSLTEKLIGRKTCYFSGFMFIFLYYCLVIAYISAGIPFLTHFFEFLQIDINSFFTSLIFVIIIGILVSKGAESISRVNAVLSIAMAVTFVFVIYFGLNSIPMKQLHSSSFKTAAFAVPILFGAFGFHNVIPSLVEYLDKDKKSLRFSIITGTIIVTVIYVSWQYFFIKTTSVESLLEARNNGEIATQALKFNNISPILLLLTNYFSLFALLTSLLGVSLSLMDFLKDGFKILNVNISKELRSALIFIPTFICFLINPNLFSKALSIAGGFGEAYLNGILPVLLVWSGYYFLKLKCDNKFYRNKIVLASLCLMAILCIVLETIHLIKH